MDQTTNVIPLRPGKTLGQLLTEMEAAIAAFDQALAETGFGLKLPPGQLDPRD